MTPDFIVTNMGTTILIRPVTREAVAYIDENVEVADWQKLGDSFGVDHRPGWGLVDLLEDDGRFVVEVRHPKAASAKRTAEIGREMNAARGIRGLDLIDPQPFVDGWHNRDPH